eukprot:3780089-Rhodomonas_salina.4
MRGSVRRGVAASPGSCGTLPRMEHGKPTRRVEVKRRHLLLPLPLCTHPCHSTPPAPHALGAWHATSMCDQRFGFGSNSGWKHRTSACDVGPGSSQLEEQLPRSIPELRGSTHSLISAVASIQPLNSNDNASLLRAVR